MWGGLHEAARAVLSWQPEMALLPGFVLIGFAAAGLFFSVWPLRPAAAARRRGGQRRLAMGTQFFDGGLPTSRCTNTCPGWDAIRTPGRLIIWTTLLLGVLAAGAVSAFRPGPRLWQGSPRRARGCGWRPCCRCLVLAEGINTTPHPLVPKQPAAMRTVEGPVLVLPTTRSST